MKQDVILVLDCGATNVRAMAVDRQGNIIARAATANASDIAAENSDWHQWSLEAIMQRFADCCRQIHDQLASCTVRGITVTTFGVDGTLVDEQGALLYPIISWKCPRTAAVMENISQYMPAHQLQQIAGVGAFAFNTLYKLIWLKECHPQLLAQAHAAVYFVADQPPADRGVHHRPHHGGHQPDARSAAARFQRANPAGDRPAAPPVPAAG